jgi:putative SOS response-associated peptidase YedK
MPVILHPEAYDRWLDDADATKLAVPFPSQLMALA